MTSATLSHRASATLNQLFLVIYRCHPYGALLCIWKNRFLLRCRPYGALVFIHEWIKPLKYQLGEIAVLYFLVFNLLGVDTSKANGGSSINPSTPKGLVKGWLNN